MKKDIKKITGRSEIDIQETKCRMKNLRKQRRLTQVALSMKPGFAYSVDSIKQAESGKKDVSDGILEAYGKYFGVSREYLLWGEEVEESNLPKEKDLKFFKSMSKSEQKKIVIWFIENSY